MEDMDEDAFFGYVLEPTNGVLGDCAALLHIKPLARQCYLKEWEKLKEFLTDINLDEESPSEAALEKYFLYLRDDKTLASLSLWTVYSMLNSVYKESMALTSFISKIKKSPEVL